jgi:hypothetical protein
MTKTNFDLTGIFSKSWEIFKKHLGFFILYFLITIFLNVPSNMDDQAQRMAFENGERYYSNPLLSFLIIVFAIISIIISYGYIVSLLKMVKDKAVTIKDLWYPNVGIFSVFFAYLILSPLFFIIVLIILTPLFISIFNSISQVTSNSAVTNTSLINLSTLFLSNFLIFIVSMLILTIANLLIMTRLGFITYFIIDKNLGPINGIKASWNATKGKFLSLLVFFIQIVGLNILGALALGVGLFITIPMSSIAMSYAYLKLSGDADLDEIDDFPETTELEKNSTLPEEIESPKKEAVSKPKKAAAIKKPAKPKTSTTKSQ